LDFHIFNERAARDRRAPGYQGSPPYWQRTILRSSRLPKLSAALLRGSELHEGLRRKREADAQDAISNASTNWQVGIEVIGNTRNNRQAQATAACLITRPGRTGASGAQGQRV
jgi:hypothetical protein